MKKRFFIITFLSLIIFMISGCNETKKIVLTIGFWPESTETEDVKMYNKWKDAFEEAYPQYEIVAEPYTYATDTVGSKYLTGTLPMVFQTWFTEPEKLKNKKIIRDITDILDELGWTDKMDDEMRETLTFDGKIYGIPRDGYGLGLLINIKTLGDNGLLPEDGKGGYLLYNADGSPAYPTTFEEIYEYSKVIQEYDETKGILICSDNKNGGWQLSNIAWNYGATLETLNSDGTVTASLASDGMVSALEWIKKMKSEELLLNSTNVLYDQWYSAIESQVAMAIVGSDVLQLAQTNGNVNMDDLAFVPMPTGDGVHRYSLYGGTPFVFTDGTTDEEVKGILTFFDFIGRSPSTSETNLNAMKEGYEVAVIKGQPIIPTIKAWKDPDYLREANALETEYVNIDMYYYQDFFDSIGTMKRSEEPYYAQEMYEFLDTAIQNVLTNPDTANCKNLLTTANSKLQELLNKMNS